jgi:hypothetical protein
MTQDYRDVLWVLTSEEGDEEECVLRSFSDEAALFETTDAAQSDMAFKVEMPLKKLVGNRDYKTKWTQERVPMEEAIEAGRKLYEALPHELVSIFDEVPADPRPLRLKIYSPQPRITDLPWEWLNNGSGQPVALRANVRLARCVPLRFEIPHLTVALPVKVLVVLTNPKDEQLLDVNRELEVVTGSLLAPSYEMRVCPEPNVEVLKEELHNFLPHIVHYIGHAGINNGEGNIILHDSYNRTYWMPASFLSRILPSTVRLICLSTCVTVPNYQLLGLPHLADSIGDINLPTVIANRYPLGQESAAIFWRGFYDVLVQERGNVNEAMHQARIDVWLAANQSADWASFSLVLRDRTGKALNIVQGQPADLEAIQASELQAKYAARLANDLAEHVSVYGEYATEGIRESARAAIQDASESLADTQNLVAEL